MRIRFDFADGSLDATLDTSATARDFAALLPLTLTLEDYEATEKISDLPGKLSTTGAPSGIAPRIGDIAYYAPWGNLALFYRDFRHSSGLVRLGRFDGSVDVLRRAGAMVVTIVAGE